MIEIILRGGLCNRMRVIASAVAFSRDVQQPLTVVWPLNDELNCPYELLFQKPIAFRVRTKQPVVRNIFSRKRKVFISNQQIYAWRNSGWDLDHFRSHLLKQATNSHVIIETDWGFYPTGADEFDFAKPTSGLQQEINAVTSSFYDKTIGVHIRRTDHIPSIQESPTEDFLIMMQLEKEKEPATRFFLATDSEETQTAIRERFPNDVISYSRDKSRTRPEGVMEALVDLYCLAATKKILGSHFSSFSETAGKLMGSPLTIIRRANG